MNRRDFVASTIKGLAMVGLANMPLGVGAMPPARKLKSFKFMPVSKVPGNYFFGHNLTSPFNRSGKWLLAIETQNEVHKLPKAGQEAMVGILETDSGRYYPISPTTAWNYQSGANLIWNPAYPEVEFFFNTIEKGKLVGMRANVTTGTADVLGQPVSDVSSNGKQILTLSFQRLSRMNPAEGYAGLTDLYAKENHPETDGVFITDIDKKSSRLILSFARIFDALRLSNPDIVDENIFLEEVKFCPNASRFMMLVKAWDHSSGVMRAKSALLTAFANGTDVRVVIPWGKGVSSADWKDNKTLIACFKYRPGVYNFVLVSDGKDDHSIIGDEKIMSEGNLAISPNGEWIVTERAQRDYKERSLYLYHIKTGDFRKLGSFNMPDDTYMRGDLRCELNPRWSEDGNMICIDYVDTPTKSRQIGVFKLVWG